MEETELNNLMENQQAICTYIYRGLPFAFTFKIEGNTHFIMNDECDWIDQRSAVVFGDEVSDVKYFVV